MPVSGYKKKTNLSNKYNQSQRVEILSYWSRHSYRKIAPAFMLHVARNFPKVCFDNKILINESPFEEMNIYVIIQVTKYKDFNVLKGKKFLRHESFAVSWLRSEIRESKIPPKMLF